MSFVIVLCGSHPKYRDGKARVDDHLGETPKSVGGQETRRKLPTARNHILVEHTVRLDAACPEKCVCPETRYEPRPSSIIITAVFIFGEMGGCIDYEKLNWGRCRFGLRFVMNVCQGTTPLYNTSIATVG